MVKYHKNITWSREQVEILIISVSDLNPSLNLISLCSSILIEKAFLFDPNAPLYQSSLF